MNCVSYLDECGRSECFTAGHFLASKDTCNMSKKKDDRSAEAHSDLVMSRACLADVLPKKPFLAAFVLCSFALALAVLTASRNRGRCSYNLLCLSWEKDIVRRATFSLPSVSWPLMLVFLFQCVHVCEVQLANSPKASDKGPRHCSSCSFFTFTTWNLIPKSMRFPSRLAG